MSIAETNIILLPGLDGTAQLFKRFIAAAPPHLSLTPIALPPEPRTYAELADEIANALPGAELSWLQSRAPDRSRLRSPAGEL